MFSLLGHTSKTADLVLRKKSLFFFKHRRDYLVNLPPVMILDRHCSAVMHAVMHALVHCAYLLKLLIP